LNTSGATTRRGLQTGDRALIITESAIDALSYFQLHPERAACARFLSTAGAPSAHQLEVIDRIFGKLPEASTVLAAVDSDAAGDKLASRIEEIARGRSAIAFRRHSPSPAKDWNDVLQQVERGYIRSLERPAERPLSSGPPRDRQVAQPEKSPLAMRRYDWAPLSEADAAMLRRLRDRSQDRGR
jgi:hypothetical protein